MRVRDKTLVLDKTFLDLDIEEKIRDADESGRNLVVHLTLSELDDLLGHVAAAANHEEDSTLQASLDDLYDRLRVYEDRYEDDLSGA